MAQTCKCVRSCFDNQAGMYYYAERTYQMDRSHPLAMHFIDSEGNPLAPLPPEFTEIRSGRMSKPTTEERLEQAVAIIESGAAVEPQVAPHSDPDADQKAILRERKAAQKAAASERMKRMWEEKRKKAQNATPTAVDPAAGS